MLTPISRSPNDPAETGGAAGPTSSRVTAGVPRPPLRFLPRKPPLPEPADQSTLDMLGTNPLNSPDASLADAATGGPGFLMGSLAMTARGIQGLVVGAPGFVPPEILMWLQNAMQQLPQLLSQQSSALTAPPSVAQQPQSAPPTPSGAPPQAGMGGAALPVGGGPPIQ